MIEPGALDTVYSGRRPAAGPCDASPDVKNERASRYSAAFRMA